MHPLLARPHRLALYLLCWAPIVAMLVYLIASTTGARVVPVTLATAPVSVLYAFMCLSSWYACRRLPLERSSLPKLLSVHGATSLVDAGVWAYVGWGAFEWSGVEKQAASRAALMLLGFGVPLYLLSVAFHYVLISLEASREARRREQEARVLAGQAELRALKAQLNPHFLYNSLNSISALTSVDAAGARHMCVLLSDFMRRTLGLGDRAAITLAEELSLARCFLAVEQVRFGSRLHYEEQIETGAENCLVPPLVLQPLIENAITHGIAHLPEGGSLRLRAQCADGYLSILVDNVFDPESEPVRGGGVGIANVRQRLETRYGDQARLRVAAVGERFQANLSLPVERA